MPVYKSFTFLVRFIPEYFTIFDITVNVFFLKKI